MLSSRFPASVAVLAFALSAFPTTRDPDDPVASVKACLGAVLQSQDVRVGELVVSGSGDALSVTGPSTLFGLEAQVSASFAAGKLKTIGVTCPSGTISLDSLDRVAGGGMRPLLANVPGVGEVSLRKLALTVGADGSTPEAVTLGLGHGKSWDLLGAGAARLEDVGFELTVAQPKEGGRSVRGTLAGTLRLGSAGLALRGTLANRAEDLQLSASQTGSGGNLRDAVMALLPREATSIFDKTPGKVGSCPLTDLGVTVRPAARAVSLRCNSELGRLVLAGRADRGTPSFTATFCPPRGFKLAQLDGALGSLDAAEIDLSNLALVLASADGQVQDAVEGVLAAGTPVVKGVNLIARLDLQKLKVADLLHVRHLDLRAGIPFPNPLDLVLAAAIRTDIDLGANAKFKEVTFELRPNPRRFQLGLVGKVDLRVGQDVLLMRGEMSLEPLTQTASVTMSLDPARGEWREPFGLASVGVEKLAASLGVTFGAGIPLPTIGLQGGLRLGTGPNPVHGAGVVVLNPRDPMHSMVALDLENVTLPRLIGLASAQAAASIARSPLGSALNSLEIKKVAIRIVPDDVDFAGTRFERGYRFAGEFDVLGATARGLFELDYERGISALATVSAIRIGNVFTLTGARGRPDPIVKLDLRTDQQEFLVSGSVTLLENLFGQGKHFFVSETDLHVQPGGFGLYAHGKVLGALDTELECSASGSIRDKTAEFALRVKMEQTALKELHDRALREIDAATRDHVAQINKAKSDVAKAQAEVQRWDRDIEATRQRVAARQKRDLDAMRAKADADKRAAEAEYRRLGAIIADRNRRIDKGEFWLAAEVGWLETRRNVQLVAVRDIGSNLTKGLARLGDQFPKELSSELGPMIAGKEIAAASLKVSQGVLDGYKVLVKGTMGAARWIADNGLGNAFDLNLMQFATRLSTIKDSFVQLDFRGRFCGEDFRTSMRLDISSPEAMARDIAKALVEGKAPNANFADLSLASRGLANFEGPRSMPQLTTAQLLERATTAVAVASRTPAGKPVPASTLPPAKRPEPVPAPTPAAIDLSGEWRDLNACQIRIEQKGATVAVTMLTESGKQWWTTAQGTLSGTSLRQRHLRGTSVTAEVTGTVQDGGRRIQWSNGTTWQKTSR